MSLPGHLHAPGLRSHLFSLVAPAGKLIAVTAELNRGAFVPRPPAPAHPHAGMDTARSETWHREPFSCPLRPLGESRAWRVGPRLSGPVPKWGIPARALGPRGKAATSLSHELALTFQARWVAGGLTLQTHTNTALSSLPPGTLTSVTPLPCQGSSSPWREVPPSLSPAFPALVCKQHHHSLIRLFVHSFLI